MVLNKAALILAAQSMQGIGHHAVEAGRNMERMRLFAESVSDRDLRGMPQLPKKQKFTPKLNNKSKRY